MIAQTTTKIEQAELLIVAMDAVQAELESASDYDLFESCKAELAGLKSEIEALGYQVERCVNGWRRVATQEVVEPMKTLEQLQAKDFQSWMSKQAREHGRRWEVASIQKSAVEMWLKELGYEEIGFLAGGEVERDGQRLKSGFEASGYYMFNEDGMMELRAGRWVEIAAMEDPEAYLLQRADAAPPSERAESPEQEVAQTASCPTGELHEDEQGLYAEVASSNGRTSYTVRVCARWLYSVSCDCAASQHSRDCCHRNQVDKRLRDVRPTFKEWVLGKGASRETIASLVATPDRYREPLKGSGVTGFRAAETRRKLAA